VRDTDVADASGGFPFAHRLRVRLDVEQVVHLHEVHALRLHETKGFLHLPDALLAAAGPDLGREEKAVAQAEL
jgi:hypothetical protein